ncbi:MAG: hypothetical protein ACLUNO_09860 [Oscillospiraceae bacterium]
MHRSVPVRRRRSRRCAFVTMLFVRHGDSHPIPAKGLEALDVDD